MKERWGSPSIVDRLAANTEEDLQSAAEAVVDAALACRKLHGNFRVSEETRRLLIEAVYHEPLLTGPLFQGDMIEFEHC